MLNKKIATSSGVALAALFAFSPLGACRDVSHFSSHGDRFQGEVVAGSFVRSGVAENTQACVTIDTDHLQDAPGTLTTSDGRFKSTPLRPIPQLWHDPLSTLAFGDGRVQNLVYAATPLIGDAGPEEAQDIFVVISLMQQDRHIEVRLLRGAPQTDAGATPPGVASTVFAVFHLERERGPCSF
jgi:hypothetical protein